MPTTEQKNAGLIRYMEKIDDEYRSRQERARLGPYGASAEAPPPPTPPLTRAQEDAIAKSTLGMLIQLEKAETDRAKALEPDFQKTLAYAALEFHKEIAKAQMAASGSGSAAKVRTWGVLAKESLDTMTEIEKRQNAVITGGAATQRNINTMIADLYEVPSSQLDAVALDSQFAENFTVLIAEAPEGEAGVRLARLAAGTGHSPEDLITLAKNALGGLQTPVLDVALREIDTQDQNDIADYMRARKRLSGAARRIDAQGVGTGSSARKGEALLTDFLNAAGVLGTADPDAYAQLLGLGGVREIKESPNAVLARQIIEKRMNFSESEWARRTIHDWIRAAKEGPEFEEYMRSKGMVDAQGNILRHKKEEAYEQLRKDWKRGRLQETAAPAARKSRGERGPGGAVREHLRQQIRRVFGADQESREQRLESLKERRDDPRERKLWVTSEGEPTYAPPVAADARIRRLERLTGSEDADDVASPAGEAPLSEEEDRPFFGTEKHVLDGGEAAAPGPQATLPPGAINTGTEGWADYAKYPDGTIRFVHPKTGKLVTVTEASDPTSFNAIMEKAFGMPGTATSPGQEGAISAQTPAGTPIDEFGFPMQSDAMTGESAAPAETGGLPGFGSIQTPQPGQAAAPAGQTGTPATSYGSGVIPGDVAMGASAAVQRGLSESLQGIRDSGAETRRRGEWLQANREQLQRDAAGAPVPPTPGEPLYEEWQAHVQGERAYNDPATVADRSRMQQEAAAWEGAQEAETAGLSQEQADAANVVGDRDAMIADQSAFEQTREPTRMAPGPEGHIIGDVPPTTDAIAPEGYQDLPAEPANTSPRPHTQAQGYDTLTPLDSTPHDATQPFDPTEGTLQAEGQVYGQGPQVRLGEEEAMAAKGGKLGSWMPGSTEGGMRDPDADDEADFAAAEKEIEDRLGISEEDVATGSPLTEGGTTVEKEKAAKEPKEEEEEEEKEDTRAEPQREEPPGATPHRDTSIEPIAEVQPVTNFEAQAHKITPLRPSAGAAVASHPGMSQASVDPSIGMDSRGVQATKNIRALLQSAKQEEDPQKAPQGPRSVPGRP